jgi:hypothetical protein
MIFTNTCNTSRRVQNLLVFGFLVFQLIAAPSAQAVEKKNVAYLMPILNLLLDQSESSIVGFVWANQPSTQEYQADAAHSYNSTGSPIIVTREGLGFYEVDFVGQNLSRGAINLQLTSTNSNSICNFGKTTRVSALSVSCVDESGNPVDSSFSFLASQTNRHSQAGFVAYAYFGTSSSTSTYTAAEEFAFTITGSLPTARKISSGQYTVTFPAGLVSGSNIQISSYQLNVYCSASSWNSTSVSVKCYSSDGELVDAIFAIALARQINPSEKSAKITGFVRAFGDISETIRPASPRGFNSAGGNVDLTRLSTGVYLVEFVGLANTVGADHRGIVLVRSYDDRALCALSAFGGAVVRVNCMNQQNEFVDALFSLQLIRRN